MSPIEGVAVVVSAVGVWLTARRVRWCWPVGIVGVLLYAWLFYGWKLYSDMMLQAVYVILQLYGWWRWKGDTTSEEPIAIKPLPSRVCLVSVGAGGVGAVVLGVLMQRYTDASLPWADASLTTFSLVATLWAARKYLENWFLWIAIDSVYVCMFLCKNLYPTAGLYAAFVVLAAYGAWAWRAGRKEHHAARAGAPER